VSSKVCYKCKEEKLLGSFYKRAASKDGLCSECKDCNRIRTRKARQTWRAKHPEKSRLWGRKHDMIRRFGPGISEVYNSLLEAQRGVCAICQKPEPVKSRADGAARNLAIDHEHGSGVIRGLLCTRCNSGLGHFIDNPAFLRKAAWYLDGQLESS
jgi:hypothetical protein